MQQYTLTIYIQYINTIKYAKSIQNIDNITLYE